MSKTLELDDMSKDELIALKEEINHRLKDASFWETIEVLSAIDVKAIRLKDKREKIARSCIELKKLEALGFTLVIFSTSQNRVGFINYNIPQIGDKFYGFVVTKDGISHKSSEYQTLSDDDITAISRIFEQEVIQS